MSSIELVKSLTSSGLSAKVIMKTSSCGFAVLKNSTTASRARSILELMLPLMSKITPSETGASSLENDLISCWLLPSNTEKLSLSSPVTKRFIGSVMVTGTRTSSTEDLYGRVCEAKPDSFTSSVVAGLVSMRGWMWTSSTVFCAQISELGTHSNRRVRAETRQTYCEKRCVRSIVLIPFLEGAELRNRSRVLRKDPRPHWRVMQVTSLSGSYHSFTERAPGKIQYFVTVLSLWSQVGEHSDQDRNGGNERRTGRKRIVTT